MPVIINEVVAELEPGGNEQPSDGIVQAVPLTSAEQELLKTLHLQQLRQERLQID